MTSPEGLPGTRLIPSLLLMASLIALAPPPSAAQDCGDEATQTDMNMCAGRAFDAADDLLNRLYKQMTARLSDDTAATRLLVTAQRAWISYRDAECGFAASGVEGGSIYPMILSQCLTDLTNARAADFSRYLSCEEGDLSCPLPPG